MRFSTVFSVLTCGAMAMAAAIAPAALVSRSNSDIAKVIADLDVKVDVHLALLDSCKDDECTDSILLKIVADVDVATSACIDLEGVVDVDLAKIIADVIIKITVKLNDHKSSCGCGGGDPAIYAKIDLCLNLLLKQLDICISGILSLVIKLLVSIKVDLKLLGLDLLLKLCLSISL